MLYPEKESSLKPFEGASKTTHVHQPSPGDNIQVTGQEFIGPEKKIKNFSVFLCFSPSFLRDVPILLGSIPSLLRTLQCSTFSLFFPTETGFSGPSFGTSSVLGIQDGLPRWFRRERLRLELLKSENPGNQSDLRGVFLLTKCQRSKVSEKAQ